MGLFIDVEECGEHEGTQEPYAFEVAVDPD